MFSIRNFIVFIAYKFNSRSITSFVRYVPRKCQKTVFSRFFKFRTRNMIVNNSRLVSDTKTFVYAMESKFSGLSAYIWLCSLFFTISLIFLHILDISRDFFHKFWLCDVTATTVFEIREIILYLSKAHRILYNPLLMFIVPPITYFSQNDK